MWGTLIPQTKSWHFFKMEEICFHLKYCCYGFIYYIIIILSHAALGFEERHTWVWNLWHFESQYGFRWGLPVLGIAPPLSFSLSIFPLCTRTWMFTEEQLPFTPKRHSSALSHYTTQHEISQRSVPHWLALKVNLVMKNTTPRIQENRHISWRYSWWCSLKTSGVPG